MSSEPKDGWLARSLRSAREEVAKWPQWKREAMRVLPDKPGSVVARMRGCDCITMNAGATYFPSASCPLHARSAK